MPPSVPVVIGAAGVPRLISGEGRLFTPPLGRYRSKTGAWRGGSTSTAMAREICTVTGASTGPVMVYQIGSYRYWAKELWRDDFVFGQFGENFTVEGLPDDEVCIGDRYRIGSALFEVTQPRVSCYRVGIRMDEPRMAASDAGDPLHCGISILPVTAMGQ